jgi:alpha-tubulin suppressor-like RCC1 family protein
VRVGSVAAFDTGSYVVAASGELRAWGNNRGRQGPDPLGHGEQSCCPMPKVIESLRNVKVDAVAAGERRRVALAEDWSVYAWGYVDWAGLGVLGLSKGEMEPRDRYSVANGEPAQPLPPPRRVPELRVCGLRGAGTLSL